MSQGSGELASLGAVGAVTMLREGRISCEELVSACLERIAEREENVAAWVHLDPECARRQARERDGIHRQGLPMGPLHGVPVGVKDIFDTFDQPTEDGTILHAGRRPQADATVVARLRQAGAVIMGKTVTSELAVSAAGKTRNPHDPTRTPGGSSSGSAAAVAAEMVPLAVGTQTNGSVIRPASYCGVCGFKPTYGSISRQGILQQSRPLDQVGVFARTVEDVALIAEVLMGFDPSDPDTRPQARPQLLQTCHQDPPVIPRLAFVRTPVWEHAADDTRAAFTELVDHLGAQIEEVRLPPRFDDAVEWHRTIMEADLAKSFRREYEHGADQLSAVLREKIERGNAVRAVDYNLAVERIVWLNRALGEVFEEWDAILTPATTGEAGLFAPGQDSTGSPIFCTLWTLCGAPALTVPILQGTSGLPLGVQLVGPRGGDGQLLRTARWLLGKVDN